MIDNTGWLIAPLSFLVFRLKGVATFGPGIVLALVMLSLPGLYLGLRVGNRIFQGLPQAWFGRILGAPVIVSGLKRLI